MKKSRYEKLKEMSIEEVAEAMEKFVDLIEENGFSACIVCPLGIKDTVKCGKNEICNKMSNKETFINYLNGRE